VSDVRGVQSIDKWEHDASGLEKLGKVKLEEGRGIFLLDKLTKHSDLHCK